MGQVNMDDSGGSAAAIVLVVVVLLVLVLLVLWLAGVFQPKTPVEPETNGLLFLLGL
jgi:hypothetical protein